MIGAGRALAMITAAASSQPLTIKISHTLLGDIITGLGLRSGDPSKAYLMILHSYLHAPGEICCVLELHLMKLVEVLIQVMVSAQHEELLASCLQRLITLLPDSIVH